MVVKQIVAPANPIINAEAGAIRAMLDAYLAGELLGGNLAISVHEDDEGFRRFGFHNQCFDNRVLRHIQFPRGYAGSTVFLIGVKMGRKGNLMTFQKSGCRGFRCVAVGVGHGGALMSWVFEIRGPSEFEGLGRIIAKAEVKTWTRVATSRFHSRWRVDQPLGWWRLWRDLSRSLATWVYT